MFSYRHAYHAGNHADVLKHITLIALLDYLTQKDKTLSCIDTHAGIGIYPLRGQEAQTSGEAAGGIFALQDWLTGQKKADVAPAIARYAQVVQATGNPNIYPGSPWLMQYLLRTDLGAPVQDKLHLFELNPRDARLLQGNLDGLLPRNALQLKDSDGFTALKALLPPPSRRALVLIDPSYELKTDYGQVASVLEDALVRFATGCYAIWYPIVGRQEAHDLPRRLKKICATAGKDWLHATFNIGTGDDAYTPDPKLSRTATGRYVPVAANKVHTGLRESGMFIVNPPFVLAEQLQAALPQLKTALGQGASSSYLLEASA
ncbi:MAG: 23S rRNA (adenine(2030)-N(6))-methyltransferase RlmJ [Brachymonas sp.]